MGSRKAPQPPPNRSPERTYGTVHLKDWLRNEGVSYMNVRGYLRLVTDQDTFGFRAKGNETNWGVEVTSFGEERRLIVLGCQIRAVGTHRDDGERTVVDTLVL